MSIIDTLITNRTQADVDALLALYAKPKAMWTADEWNEFLLGNHRGAYNATDMNRVLDALDYLAERVTEFGYQKPEIKRPNISEVIPGTSKLPSGYTELKYIQSTGEQCVNTLFTPNQDTRIVLKYGGCNASEWREVFGAGVSVKVPSRNFVCVQHSSNGVMAELGTEYYTGPTTTDGAILELNKNQFYVNGTLVKTFTYAAFTSPYTMRLFDAATDSEDYSCYAGKLYYCQIYDNGTLIRDYVPCLNPSNEVGLYDIVNGVFYGNAGTGSFIAGEELEGATNSTTVIRNYYKIGDCPTVSELAQYLNNVSTVRSVLELPESVPEVPADISKKIPIKEANNIEIILTAVEALLNRISLSWFYSGEICSGEV